MRTPNLTPAEQFFYEHAGYSWNTSTETREQGRIRCARALAAAEARLMAQIRDHGVYFEMNADENGACDARADGTPFETCEWAGIFDSSGLVLASLGAILDADENYRRVIRAELALEAFPE